VASEKKLPISVVISAVDNVTYKVMAINEKLQADHRAQSPR
jgi:hypothetical protein